MASRKNNKGAGRAGFQAAKRNLAKQSPAERAAKAVAAIAPPEARSVLGLGGARPARGANALAFSPTTGAGRPRGRR
jgi:hypothetical protein